MTAAALVTAGPGPARPVEASSGTWGPPGTTNRLDSAGGGGNAFRPWMSGDGRHVAFDSSASEAVPEETNGVRSIFVYDRVADVTTRISVAPDGSEADGQSQRPTISGDGRYVAFWSEATNLVPEGTTRGRRHAFVHDRHAGTTRLVSVSSDGVEGNGDSLRPVISRDGRFVAFESAADNLLVEMASSAVRPTGTTPGTSSSMSSPPVPPGW